MKTIKMFDIVGEFAENKDKARDIRVKQIMPALDDGEKVILNFAKVDSATQSFIHALISEVIRKKGFDVFDLLVFKSCNKTVKSIVNIVVDYLEDALTKDKD